MPMTSMTEVVLSLLLSKFRFAPSEKEIIWEMHGLTSPTEKGHSRVARLPLKIIPL
jgi:hypothetical protein